MSEKDLSEKVANKGFTIMRWAEKANWYCKKQYKDKAFEFDKKEEPMIKRYNN